MQEFPVHTSVKGVRQFLGKASYLPGFAKIAAPLHALTRESAPFFWSLACQSAFLKLKDLLVSPPVLVDTDASIEGLGAEQEQEGGMLHPVAYDSRSFRKKLWNSRIRSI